MSIVCLSFLTLVFLYFFPIFSIKLQQTRKMYVNKQNRFKELKKEIQNILTWNNYLQTICPGRSGLTYEIFKIRAQQSILHGKLLEISKERKKNVLYKYCGDVVLSSYLSFSRKMYENLRIYILSTLQSLKKK